LVFGEEHGLNFRESEYFNAFSKYRAIKLPGLEITDKASEMAG